LPDALKRQDRAAVSEIAAKPSLVSRGFDAVAVARAYFPGVLVSLIIAVAATFLSEHYGGPVMLFALLLGMAFYFLSQEGPCVACASPSGCLALRSASAKL
jgi:hypothetical protein